MAQTGILLINTGTPDAPTEDAIRRYLGEMLSDPALVNAPRFIWKRVLKYAILPKRPARTKPAYERVWTPEGSSFMRISLAQRDSIAAAFGGRYRVELAMRYGSPSIMAGLKALADAGCDHAVLVPLYPQYVRVCAGTSLGEARRCLGELARTGWNPRVTEVPQFFDQPAYVRGVADSIRSTWLDGRAFADAERETGAKPKSKLIFSWHSTLMADIEAGDPYRDQDEATAAAVAAELGLEDDEWTISYQSRFDNRKWLQPFTTDVLAELAAEGVGDVAIVCPGFVADNIETLVEVSEELRDGFLAATDGQARFTYVPALNDSPALTQAISDAIRQALSEDAGSPSR